MTWRDELGTKLTDMREHLAAVDPELGGVMQRHLTREIGWAEEKLGRPLSQENTAQLNRSVDYLIEHAGTLRAWALQTNPLTPEHAHEAIVGLVEHLENILRRIEDPE